MREWPLVGRDAERRRLEAALGSDRAGAALVGEAGVGKTRLAVEVARSVEADGRIARWIAASPAARAIPYAPFTSLLGGEGDTAADEATLHARLMQALSEERTAAGPILLVVDDVHELDERSTGLVEQACRHGVATVLLTHRSAPVEPSPLMALWKDGIIERVELGSLDRADARQLAEAVLEGPVDGPTANDLWRRSGGNPLYLREIILGGLEAGAFERQDGLWRSTGAVPPSARLKQVVEQRLGRLDGDAERAAESLAVAGPLDFAILERLHGDAPIERLEEAGIVVVEQDGNRATARFGHPIYAEVTLARMPRSRRRRVMGSLADAVDAAGARRRDDLLRLALWRIESGGTTDRDLLIRAASDALAAFDAPLAERLARAAGALGTDVASDLLLGRSLMAQHRTEEAEQRLARAAAASASDDEIASVALARADLLYFRAGRPGDATGVLLEAIGRVEDPAWRDELEALMVLFRAAAGELRAVAESGRRIATRDGARPRTVVHTLVYSSIANVMLGRLAEGLSQAEVGLRLVPHARSELPMSGEMLAINRVMAHAYAGDLETAIELGTTGRQAALELGATDLIGMWSMNLAECLLLAGRIAESLETMLGALAAARTSDPFAVRGIQAGVAAICATWLGRPDLARSLHREIQDEQLAVDVRSRIWLDRATAWLAWADADTSGAVRLLADGARTAMADTHLVWGAWQLHDAVRLGHPGQAMGPLKALAERIEGQMVATMAAHAEALESGDGVALERVASAFERMGSTLFAAEAAVQSQQAYLRRGRVQLARVAAARASLLAARCRGVRTPALVGAAPVPLTPREQEIARLAADGLPSREVAARLEISIRTVDNHLGTIYGKLGIQGRTELPAVLGLPSTGVPSEGPST